VLYKPERQGLAASLGDGILLNSRDVFLHGRLGSKHQGAVLSLGFDVTAKEI